MDLFTSTLIKLGLIFAGILVGFSKIDTLTRANHLFWIFLMVSGAGEILEWMMATYFKQNFPYYHVFKPLFYALITVALTTEAPKLKSLFRFSIPVIWVAAFINALYLQPPTEQLNTIIISLISLLQILQVLFYIAQLFDNYNWNQTLLYHSFWIALGILVHSIISFLTLGIHNFLEKDGQKAVIPYLVISEYLFYVSFLINFLVQKKEPGINQQA